MELNRDKAQSDMVLEYLEAHGSITPLEAISELGCMRLGARIWELRHDRGIDIATKEETSLNRHKKKVRYARYILKHEEES